MRKSNTKIHSLYMRQLLDRHTAVAIDKDSLGLSPQWTHVFSDF